ncbi:helix-turn-helix domain-containing protein [Isoptericola sp. F-RaC21]|uniref:helix-turn-helix domain-containing protein n=1 Tax=Isoptericola sp. F-RaC21 TaxID=3141452 RepID=UPI00315C360D
MSDPAEYMDDSMGSIERQRIRLRDGFPGQRMRVLPSPLVAHAQDRPATAQILVTDVGYFPKAAMHGRARPKGALQDIVMICVAGRGICSTPSGDHQVRAGDALIIPAGTPHRYEAHPTDPWTIWWMHITGLAVGALLMAAGATARRPVVPLSDTSRVVALMETVLRRMGRDETESSLVAASGAAWHALALIAADPHTAHTRGANPIEATLEFLQTNFAEHVSVPELARMAGLSQSHFAALFRKATGFGVIEYQTRLCMASARELLDTTDRNIASIAQQVGYSDPLYFSRQFRRIHSLSPSEYRTRESRWAARANGPQQASPARSSRNSRTTRPDSRS